ncbi:MAG: DUF2987 domain-containing protein [Burkholderiaceae bacterium]|nr:DUF2987 domain-containing protein [Burkholderiaceae bacterium]
MKKSLLLLSFLATLVSSSALAEEREWVSYKKFIESFYLDKFYSAQPQSRDHLRLLVKLQPENKAIKASDVVLTVAHGGGRDRLAIDPEGFLEVEPNAAWLREEAMIYTNLPKGEKVHLDAWFASRTPDKLDLSYADLMASVPQWNALLKEKAGMLRFMLPTFNGIDIHFAKPAGQTLQVMAKGGARTYTADARGEIKLKLDDALMQGNPEVLLSEKPSMMEVDEI